MADTLEEAAPEFVEMAHRIVWATAATVDTAGNPSTRILHPVWQWDGSTLTGWIATSPLSTKANHLVRVPRVSLTYWTPITTHVFDDVRNLMGVVRAATKRRVEPIRRGSRAGRVQPGHHPGVDLAQHPRSAFSGWNPISLRVMDGSRMTTGSGRLLTWRADATDARLEPINNHHMRRQTCRQRELRSGRAICRQGQERSRQVTPSAAGTRSSPASRTVRGRTPSS